MNYLTTPAHGFMFAILMFGWLGCNHLGLDVALVEALAGSESSQEASTSQADFAR